MSNKPIVAIVALGVIALACMGVAAYYLGNESPKVKVKVALEREMPWVSVASIETRADGASRAQHLRLEPRDAARPLGLVDLEEAAERAVLVMTAPDLKIPIRLDALEVSAGDLTTPLWSRAELDQRVVVGGTLRAVQSEVVQLAGLAPESRLLLVGRSGAYGARFLERPPPPHTEAEAAGLLFRKMPILGYVEVPAAEPGKPLVRVDRSSTGRPGGR